MIVKRITTQSTSEGFARALKLFREAAQYVPAYKDFLRKNRIKPEHIKSVLDFQEVPPIDKENYISKYSLEELSWDGTLADAQYISSSSGSTGVPFYWPRGHAQDIPSARLYQGIFENVFGTRKGSTLCFNLFALGTWIAGVEFYNATRSSADRGNNIIIINPSIEKGAALDAVKRLMRMFDRLILTGYPPFIKDVLETGSAEGIRWKTLDVRLITAGEAVSEQWRDYVLNIIGKKGSPSHLINVYGMAEAGVVAHETPLSITCRRIVLREPERCEALVHDGGVSSLYQYDPVIRYFERDADGTLLLTSRSGLPLIRYSTRDRGGILSHAMLLQLLKDGGVSRAGKFSAWRAPALYLEDRRDLSISLYALNIYVENIKHALECAQDAAAFSGLFTMSVGHTRNYDQKFEITLELARARRPSEALRMRVTRHVVRVLSGINSEYAKLYAAIGERAAPHITFVGYGEIRTTPGRKHKWITRK